MNLAASSWSINDNFLTIPRTLGWYAQAEILASNAGVHDYFGNALAISQDTVLVGSRKEDSLRNTITNGATASNNNGKSSSGAAYVYRRSTNNKWPQQAYLKPPNVETNMGFGSAVAIDGDTIVVAADSEESISGVTLNDGTSSRDTSEAKVGAAYVFIRAGVSGGSTDTAATTTAGVQPSAWTLQAYLKAPNAIKAHLFGGGGVAISGDTIAVGAPGDSTSSNMIANGGTVFNTNGMSNSGAAYVFIRSNVNGASYAWGLQAFIKASNAAATREFSNVDGQGVSLSRDTLVVGVSKDKSNQEGITNGNTSSTNSDMTNSGAVFVYVRADSTWSQQAYLKAFNGGSYDYFGYAVCISGDTIVAGAYQEDGHISSGVTNEAGLSALTGGSTSNSGAAYVFVRVGSTWSTQAFLKAENGAGSDQFGYSVSVSGDSIIVGAINEDSAGGVTNSGVPSKNTGAYHSGAAYVFRRLGSTWASQSFVKAPPALNPNPNPD